MQKPEKFISGETLQKDIGPKLNKLVDYVLSLTPISDNTDIIIKPSPGGTYFRVPRRQIFKPSASGGSNTYLAVVNARITTRRYLVDIYDKAYDILTTPSASEKLYENVEMFTPFLDDTLEADRIPANTKLLVVPMNIPVYPATSPMTYTSGWVPSERLTFI